MTPKMRWKFAFREFRFKYSQIPLSERYSASCILHVNGMDVEVWVIHNKFSICRANEGAQLGQFSRQDFHLHLNAFMVLKDFDREVLEAMRWDNKRSFRLGFKLPK